MKRARFSDVISVASNLVICLFFLCSVPESKVEGFSPLIVVVQRDWLLTEDEPVGTKVAQAGVDGQHGNVEFDIEPSMNDGSKYFRIDKITGAIYLNESLEGKKTQKGQEYYLDVVGHSTKSTANARTTVRITVVPSGKKGETPNWSSIPKPPSFPPTSVPPGSVWPLKPPMITPNPEEGLIPNEQSQSNTASDKTSSPPSFESKPVFPTQATNVDKNDINNAVPSAENNSGSVGGHDGVNYNPLAPNSQESVEITNNDIRNEKMTKNGSSIGTILKDPEEDGNSIVLLIVVPLVIILGVIPLIIGSMLYYRRKSKLVKRPTKEIRKESAATSNSSVTMSGETDSPSVLAQWIGKRAQSNRYESWNPDDPSAPVQDRWEFPRHHLQIGGILGEGCFGQVWKCEALNIDGKDGTTTVAVKTLKESAGERERQDLLSELSVMKMLDSHPNVVRLLGCCTEKDPIFVIMEYVALGKLQSFLRNSRASHYYGNLHGDSTTLSSKDLTAFAYQIARGMEYLSSKGIIHRDLAARNILLDEEKKCKVADFGFARDVVANHVYERKTDGRLPVRWMAPEALYDNIFTTKTDVWSFGVLLWEIVTLGSTPYPGLGATEVMRKVRDGYRLEKPEHCRREFYNIMFYCWAHSPDDRPTFTDLVNFLRHLLFSEADYIDLDRFPDHDYYNMSSISGEKL